MSKQEKWKSLFLHRKIPRSQAGITSNLSGYASSSNLFSPYNINMNSNSMRSLHQIKKNLSRQKSRHYERAYTSSDEIEENNQESKPQNKKEQYIFKTMLSKAIDKNQDLSKLLQLKEMQYLKLRKINEKLKVKNARLIEAREKIQVEQDAINRDIDLLHSRIQQLSTYYKKSISSQKQNNENNKNRLQSRISQLRKQHELYNNFIKNISIDLKTITSYPTANLKKLWKQWQKIFEKISLQNS